MDESWLGLLTPVQLQAVSVRLLRELKETRDRLNQSPSNSSKPPSSRPAWETSPAAGTTPAQAPASEATTAGACAGPDAGPSSPSPAASSGRTRASGGESTGRKAGKQPGAKGHGRTQRFAIDDTVAHYPEHCAACGLALTRELAQAYTGWDEIEIAAGIAGQPGLRLEVNRHLLHASTCGCGHVTRAPHYTAPEDPCWDKVALGQWRLIGPRLGGAIVFLALRMRLSRARIREFFIELFDLQLSTGVIDETIREAGRAVAPLEDEMVSEIEQAALLHADETPWKEGRRLLWLWVFVAGYTTLFFIGYRSLEILSNLLTAKFKGNLMSDGYLAYRHLERRLRCWAHLTRKCQGLIESTDARVSHAGQAMLDVLCTLMEAIYAARATPGEAGGALASQYAPDIERLRQLCERHQADEHKKLGELAREFLLDWDVIVRQVAEPHLPLTNNAAEQALRHWVIARRISLGTRSEAGTRAFALLASVIETCRKRSASAWTYIASVLAAARKGLALPPLPPIPTGV
jgi:transposase